MSAVPTITNMKRSGRGIIVIEDDDPIKGDVTVNGKDHLVDVNTGTRLLTIPLERIVLIEWDTEG